MNLVAGVSNVSLGVSSAEARRKPGVSTKHATWLARHVVGVSYVPFGVTWA